MVASSPFPGPSRLRRSLARSRETHFTRPNRRAGSQAKIALVSVHRLTEQLYAMSTLKFRYNDLSLRVEFCTSFSFIYNTIRQRQTRPQPVQKTSDSVVLISHTYSRQPKYKHKGPQRLRFSPGNLFWDLFTKQNTENYFHHGINITASQRPSPTFRGNRNTIIVSDSQTSLLPIFSEGGGTSVHRLLCACIMWCPLHNNNAKLPNEPFNGGCKPMTTIVSFSFWR